VILLLALGALALLSMLLLAWQVLAAARFPLHRRDADNSFAPSITVLKPLKGFDEHNRECLKSWLIQNYSGPLRILFGVADETDPACEQVRSLLKEFPSVNAELVVTPEQLGANAKVSTLIQLYRKCLAKVAKPTKDETASRTSRPAQDLILISDADVRVPSDFLTNAVAPFRDERVGLVSSFYQLANPANFAMQVEAVAINADFWSQVLQSNTLKPQDFALGAVMITRSSHVDALRGFEELADYLADDYQLGNRVARSGSRVALTPLVVECWDSPADWKQVWNHQLRWARTIRVSQPLPYFFSVLSNVSLWVTLFGIAVLSRVVYRVAPGYPQHVDLLWLFAGILVLGAGFLARIATAKFLIERLTKKIFPPKLSHAVIAKDFLQFGVWLASFCGNQVNWRGRRFRVQRGGKLVQMK
jgi:ceramide glucosyltransferase